MLLTSWIRALRQSFTRRRFTHARRKSTDFRPQTARHARVAEVLEERSLLSIRPLVIDINSVTGNNQFTSTATTPGISITNSTLDPNNDGISDYDDLVIGVSQSSTFESTVISGAGVGIRINLSNLTGLNHITIDNVNISAGANLQGISVTLDNVALQSLAVDQTNITPTSGSLTAGLDVSLKNMSSTAGVDVSVQNSNIRTGSTTANGVNISLESVSKATHVGELTLADSTVEGFNVATSANSILYATIDQASARNNRIQDGAANPNARGITYNLTRTTVGDLRIEDNVNLRNVAVTAINSPLKSVSISDNLNFNVGGFVATDPIRDAIRINATSTNAAGTQRSDVTNLRIAGNTITGNLANTNTANGLVMNLVDSNLGDYLVANAGATITNNTISNLSGSAVNPAAAISITATASSTFVAANGGRPLLLDFQGDNTANDRNGIATNTITNNNGRGLLVATAKDTNFLGDIIGNTVDGMTAPNRFEGVSLTFADRPTLASADSFSLNFSDNTINRTRGTAVGMTLQNTATGSFVIQNNEITNTTDSPSSTPNALSLKLVGTTNNQEATNVLKKSVIEDNFIGITRTGLAGPNNASGIFIDSQEASTVQDLQILDNNLRNNGTNNTHAGLLFVREDKSVLSSSSPTARAITISGNTVGENRNGILLDARNGSFDLLDFAVSNNFVGVDATGADIGNIDDGINLRSEADARLLADLTNNQIRFNNGNGINLNDVFDNFSTDKRQVGGTWINNTISDNGQNGILITGRHGLSDETTGITTPLVIGEEGQGNLIENNGVNGIQIFGRVVVNTPQGILDRATATGTVSVTDNTVLSNGSTGIFVESAQEQIDIRHNQIEANTGKGIDLHVIHGIPTLPTNNGLPGILAATIRDNVVTGQRNTAANSGDGDGIQITGFELVRARLGALQEDNASLNLLNAEILNNFVDSNAGRGIDILNVGAGTMQLKIGDGTNAGRNTVIGNRLDGIRVVNSGERGQINLLDGVPTAGNPLGVTHDIVSTDAAFAPDIMLDVSRNTVRDNGIGLPASIQTGGVSEVNGSGLVILAGAVGQGADAVGTGFDFFPNEVGANSGDPLAGNGRVNLRVTNNEFEGNFGNDFAIAPYIATIAPPTTGVWDTTNYVFTMYFDPLIRVNAVVTGNTGNGMDVIRPAPDYTTDESTFKSRLRAPARVPGGPFGSGTRPRDATRLAVDGNPIFPDNGYRFVYPGIDERAYNVQTGDGSLQINNSFISIGPPASNVNISPTTLRVEAGFDRSGTTQGFAFFSPSSPGPGSDDNFDDTSVAINTGTLHIVNGREDVLWDTVQQGTFTYPNVDFPTFVTPSVSNFPTLGNTSPGTVTVNFSEAVQFVDITDFRLLRNGLPVSLAGLAVTPVSASQDPDHPGAFKSYTIDLASVTSLAGDYQFQVLAVDPSNPVFTAIRDVHLQFNNQGNPLQRVTDGAGVLQDYALNHLFTVDTSRPVATIAPVTPDPRNAAAGIVTVTFSEPVTGVDISDFELYRTVGGNTVPVNLGSVTITQVSSTQYTLNLNQLSGAPGDYDLRFVSTDKSTPIQDAALNSVFEPISTSLQSDISASDLQVTLTSASGFPASASPASPFVIQIDAEQMQVIGVSGTTLTVNRGYNGTTPAAHLAAATVTLKVAAEDSWTVDTTLPFVTSIADSLLTTTIVSPRNAQPGSVITTFSEPVIGVDVGDFTLVRTNLDGTVTNVDLSAFPLFSLSTSQYELNLGALAASAGTYQLTVNPLNSGITDIAGNAFLTSFSVSWVLDVAAPLADIADVAPDPRQTPVDALNTIFSEKVNGVNLADASTQYVLAYDDGTAATAGSISDATNAGPIVVTSAGHGLANGDRITVYGVQGNTNANGVFLVQNVTANTFELSGSTGNGIYSGGGRWVRTVSLAGFTVSPESDTRYVLNLSSVTVNQGTYIVSLLANSGITDDAGNPVGPTSGQFNVAAQDIWANGPDAAPTGTITPVTTPRGTNAGIVTVTFSEPLAKINGNSPVDSKDFKLTRTVGATTTTISLVNVPIVQTGPMTYTLDLTAAGLTDVDGTYTFQLLNTDTTGASATPLKDMTGNLLSDDSDPLTPPGVASQVVWTKTSALSGPQVTSFNDVQRGNALGSITKLRAVQTLEINFSENVTGIDLTDASKNFLLTRQATGGAAIPVSLDGVAVQQVTAKQYRIALSTLTGTDGTYRFTVLANGLITNTAATPVELKNPQTVTWVKDGTMRPSAAATDSVDTNQGNEVVGTGSGYSLRQAIQEANALAGDDVIQLGAGTYTLSLAGVQEDFAAVGDLDIRDNLVIRGKGVGVTIIDATALANQATATNRDRIFQILAGVNVTLQGITIQKGAVTGSEDGGAIRNSGNLTILDSLIQNSTSQDDAGAINNTGTLTINRTTISGNTAVATGGAIRNTGTLNVLNSTLSGNTSTSHGGALMNVAGGTALLEGATVSTNTATNGAGGGIRNDGTLRLINDTIAFNKSLSAGAGLSRNLGTVTIGNTIVSNNQLTNLTANDVAGSFTSLGGNIVQTAGGVFAGPAPTNVNPLLLPLGSYGGPTQTHSLPANSPAIDAGISAIRSADTFDLDSDGDFTELTPVDQRGALRVLDGPAAGNAVDIGAVEFGTFFVNTTDDSPDVNPGDGLAEDGLQQTSLRAAIMESNALAGESAIMLDGQVYSLKRLAPDTTPPVVTSITGVPVAPITTGGVGVVTITFSERVAGFDLGDITFTRTVGGVVTPIALSANTFQLTKVSDSVYKIENKADIANNVTNTGLTSVTQTNGLYNLTVNATGAAGTNIRDIENNQLATSANVNWVRGTDTFAPTVTMTANSTNVAQGNSDFITNGGTITVTFSEKVTGVSANNFTLTRNGTVVTGLVVTPVADNNFAGRTVVALDLKTLSAPYGTYVLTLSPSVGANVTIKDTASNNLAAGASITWTKIAALRFAPINTPRVDEVTKVDLQFTEKIAGVKLEDFTLTYDDGTGIGPQPVDLSQATLTTLGTVAAVPNFGNAAEQWELTFANKQAARDGQYVLSFNGLTNGNQLVTTATTATNVVPFTPTTATLPFQIGEDNAAIGDLDVVVGADRVQIFGKGKDDSTTVLGNPQPRTVIDGNLTDRLFDFTVGSNVAISGVEMINGKVVYQRSGGAIRNFGTLTINDSDVGTINGATVQGNFADGNGGAIDNAAPFGLLSPVTGSLQAAATAATTTLTLNTLAGFPSGAPFVIQIDSEQLQVTAINLATNQFNVSRGFNGTTPAAHLANALVTLLPSTTLNRSNVQDNTAGSTTSNTFFGKGGAIFNETGAVVINEGTFAANAAMTDGGVLYNGNTATASLLSTTLTANNAGRDGGAIYNNDTAILTVTTSTLSLNKADALVNGVAPDSDGDGGAIYNETSAKLTLDDSLLQNNSARNGGALYNDDGTLVLNRDEFGLNSALENGGAVFNTSGGSITLNDGLFTTNSASDNGGAIQNFGTLTVLDVAGSGTQFLSNEAGTDVRPGDTNDGLGGAIDNQDGVLNVNSGTFTLNRSHGDAGAIYNNGDGKLTINRTKFSRNSADKNGGVLFNNDFGQLTVDESSFANNTAGGDGGAIDNNSNFASGATVSLTVTDSTFNNNSADHGGAIFNNADDGLELTNSTLSANTASVNGGGLANFGSASLLNNTVYLNNAPAAAGIASNIDGSTPLARTTLKNTIVAGGTSSADVDGFDANFVDGGHNLIEDVGTITVFSAANGDILGQNPQLDSLRDNGGPTLTHALLFGSPARDAGDNFAVPSGDQRGFNRIFDGDGNGVATIDIGSFESGFVVNSFLDTVDQNPGDGINADKNGQSTLRAAIMEANARSGEDTIILGPGIFTLTLKGRVEDGAATGDLDITDNLNIIGAGTDQTYIDGAQIDRIFQVFPGVTLNLSNITLLNGNATSTGFGGAILNQGQTNLENVLVLNSSAGRGGGIYNDSTGTLTIDNSLLRGNLAVQQGGAIYNDGDLTLTRTDLGSASRLASAVSSTSATTITVADVSGFPTTGPFVIQVDAERMLVTAVAGNQFTVTRGYNGTVATTHTASAFATLGNFANIHGGGLFNLGIATITQVSFNGNLAESRGGGLYNAALTGQLAAVTGNLTAGIAANAATLTLVNAAAFPPAGTGTFTIQVDSEQMLVTAVNGNQFTVSRGVNGTTAAVHAANAVVTLLTISAGATSITLNSVAAFPATGSFTIQVDSEKMTATVNPGTNTLTVVRGVAGTVATTHSTGALVTSVGQNRTTIEQSTFLDNFASSRGAAVYNEEDLSIKNSTITNNDAGANAALANSVSGRVTIDNTTVVDNVAYRGGGLANSLAGSVTVHNTILANNTATTITGVTKAPNVRGSFITQGNNFVGNNADSSGFANNQNADQVGSGTSPFDPVLKALADNGGFTQTHAARTGSPIIDAGNNTGGDPFDQRGAIRPTNSDSDIGSVEQQDVHVSINDLSLKEGDSGETPFVFTLSLNKPSVQEVRVHYTLQGDTAFAGEDFVDSTGDIVFAPNQLTQTLTVLVNGDTTVEPDERFLVNLSIPSNAAFTPTLDRTQAVGTILSDDTGFRITDVNKVELETGSPDQDYVFSVSVVGALLAPNQTVSVDYAIVDGSATLGSDYTLTGPATGTLTFTAGANGELPASQTITVKVKGDELVEANENFFVNLTSADLPFEFGKDKGIGTIFNDDLGFNISNASAVEGDPPSLTPMNFVVSLAQPVYVSGINGTPTRATTTATVSTASGTATSGQDFQPVTNQVLTFSGTTTAQVVPVQIIGDLRYEVPFETFQLQVTGGTINGNVDGNVGSLSTAGTGTIIDDDPPPDQYHIYIDSGTGNIKVDLIRFAQPTLTLVDTPDHTNALSVSGDFGGVKDDLFNVDFVNGNPVPTNGLFVDGQNQVGADTAQFNNGAFSTVVYNSTGPGSGSVVFDALSTVNYTGLEPILDNTTADNRIFNAPAGATNDSIAVSASSGIVSISGTTFESVTALAPAITLTINANSGNNAIQINSSDLTFTAGLTVNAGDGNDTINLNGWALPSTINGGNGNDTITGGSNNDSIDAGDGNDTVAGGLGDDTILGGLGNDSIAAGSGNDFVDGGDGNDTIQGNDGNDTILAGNGNDNVDGGAGDDLLDGGAGDDTVAGGDGNDTVLGNDGNDSLSGGNGTDSLDGGFGDDTMSGDAGNDTINGQNGDDVVKYTDTSNSNLNFTLTTTTLTVGSEVDSLVNTERALLIAGGGNNLIDATAFTGSVTMDGGDGNDTLLGGDGSDSLIGGTGNDSLAGNNGNDTINAGDGTDSITGGAGDDSIDAGAGNDTVDGGTGNDYAFGGIGNDSLLGSAGIDTLDGGDGNDTISGGDDGDSLLGGAGQDLINGDAGDDTIDGGDGDDTAFGGDGNDYVGGGAGNDTLQGNQGDDSVNGNDGNDTLDGNIGFDTLFGGNGDDSLISDDGNDQVLGQGGSRDTFTFNGDVTLGDIFTITATTNGNPGSTEVGIGLARLNPGMSFTTILLGVEIFTLNMNGGNDLVTLGDLSSVNDISLLNINGGDGNDTVDGSLSTGMTNTNVALRLSMGLGNDSVQGTSANDTIDAGAGNDTIVANGGADSIIGGDGNDSLNGNDGADTINGGLGDDSIWGGANGDSLIGFDGKDTIWGQGGNDTIDGGVGDDFLDGGYGNSTTNGSGDDSIIGGWGNDKIAGRDGNDTLIGDSKTDTVATGNDTITGGTGNDKIDAGNGNDLVEGDDGNDTINGGAGNDFLLGGTGNDSILGGAGNDTLVGEAGDDTLDGQGGTNILVGGNGTGSDTHSSGDIRKNGVINELFKISTARPTIFNELNF